MIEKHFNDLLEHSVSTSKQDILQCQGNRRNKQNPRIMFYHDGLIAGTNKENPRIILIYQNGLNADNIKDSPSFTFLSCWIGW